MVAGLKLEVFTRLYGGDQHEEKMLVAFPRPVLPLREIIALKVRAEVERAEREREAKGQLPLSLRYLTDEDLAWARAGAVKPRQPAPPDAQAEVEKALAAFRQQRFFVVLNGSRVADLDELVELDPQSKLQFVRLLPLVGGQC
jgi:hypothetical protein